MIPRIHLFEWEDFSWFPKGLRDPMTDFLEFISHKSQMFQVVAPIIGQYMTHRKCKQITDLASGGGGPWRQLIPSLEELHPQFKVLLTDKYPNLKAFDKLASEFPNHVEYSREPVDLLNYKDTTNSLQTQFLSLHHFRPTQVEAIFRNAATHNQSILIVEGQERNLLSLIAMLFSPINVLIMTPFIRPVTAGRIVFTYLIPLLPLLVLWDGVVSVLRTYKKSELENLAQKADPEGMLKWTYGRGKGLVGVHWFIGEASA